MSSSSGSQEFLGTLRSASNQPEAATRGEHKCHPVPSGWGCHKHTWVGRTPDRPSPHPKWAAASQLLGLSLALEGCGPNVSRPNSSAEARNSDFAVRAAGFYILVMNYTFFKNTELSKPTQQQAAFSLGAARCQPLTEESMWQKIGSLLKQQTWISLFRFDSTNIYWAPNICQALF